MEKWIIFTLLYALLNGVFECSKKKAIEKSTIYEILAYFSLIAFILVAFFSKNVLEVEWEYIIIIFIKALIIVIAWILSLKAMKEMPISLYGVIKLSGIIFSIVMSLIIFGEQITLTAFIGMIIVLVGLVLVNKESNSTQKKEASIGIIIIVLISSLLNAISAIIDKIVLKSITSDQLQFWFMLFLTIAYWIILIIKEKKISFNKVKKNYWIPIVALCLIMGDRFLFIANEIPESKVSIMTILKQISTIEVIILGKFMFKEKNIIKKLLCSILVIFGIALTLY